MKKESIDKISLNDTVYDYLKERIISQEYKPGQKINEAFLAKEVGVSRTPVREAIRKLSAEGFLTTIPNQGTIVSKLSYKEINEILQIRGELESYAGWIAAAVIRRQSLDILQGMVDQMYALASDEISNENVSEFIRLDDEFHAIIAGSTKNEMLVNLLKEMKHRLIQMKPALLSDCEKLEVCAMQHEVILDALKKHDRELTREACKSHFNYIRAELLPVFYDMQSEK